MILKANMQSEYWKYYALMRYLDNLMCTWNVSSIDIKLVFALVFKTIVLTKANNLKNRKKTHERILLSVLTLQLHFQDHVPWVVYLYMYE